MSIGKRLYYMSIGKRLHYMSIGKRLYYMSIGKRQYYMFIESPKLHVTCNSRPGAQNTQNILASERKASEGEKFE